MHSKNASVDTGSFAPAPSESSESADQLTAASTRTASSLNHSGDTYTNKTNIDNDPGKASLNVPSAEPSAAPTADGVSPEEGQGAHIDNSQAQQATPSPYNAGDPSRGTWRTSWMGELSTRGGRLWARTKDMAGSIAEHLKSGNSVDNTSNDLTADAGTVVSNNNSSPPAPQPIQEGAPRFKVVLDAGGFQVEDLHDTSEYTKLYQDHYTCAIEDPERPGVHSSTLRKEIVQKYGPRLPKLERAIHIALNAECGNDVEKMVSYLSDRLGWWRWNPTWPKKYGITVQHLEKLCDSFNEDGTDHQDFQGFSDVEDVVDTSDDDSTSDDDE